MSVDISKKIFLRIEFGGGNEVPKWMEHQGYTLKDLDGQSGVGVAGATTLVPKGLEKLVDSLHERGVKSGVLCKWILSTRSTHSGGVCCWRRWAGGVR